MPKTIDAMSDGTDRSPAADVGRAPRQRVRVSDFLSRAHIELDSPDDDLSANDTLIEGEFLHQELRSGLFLHLSDAREEHAFTVKSQIREGLSCIFFLEGTVDLKIGDRRFTFAGGHHRRMEGTAIVSARRDSFERRSNAAQPLRHLVVSASPEWLGVDGFHEIRERHDLGNILKDHLRTHRWTTTPKMHELVHQIASPSGFVPQLRNLYLEGRTIELIGETLAAVMKSDRLAIGGNLLSRKDLARLERAREFIAAHLTAPLTVESIAREAGLNPSGLQHIFRLSEGMSIFEYVRKLRLENAFALLRAGRCTVAEASLIAGYSSPTNFAKAFRRRYDLSPREVLSAGPMR